MLVEMNVQDYLLCRRALEITSLLERYFACWSVILLAAPRVLSSRSLLSPSRLDYLVTNSRLDHAVLFSPKHESTIVHLFHSIYR
jgi:hypothetical protein